MTFQKEFAPSDKELDFCRRGGEWAPEGCGETATEGAGLAAGGGGSWAGTWVVSPTGHSEVEYSHLSCKGAAKDAAQMLRANRTYGRVLVAYQRDTRPTEEAANEIRAKKHLRQSREEVPPTCWAPWLPGPVQGAERDQLLPLEPVWSPASGPPPNGHH